MYSFAQRSDTRVVDEPFYAYYLMLTGKDHPGRAEVLKTQSHDLDAVFENLAHLEDTEVLFIKNMAKHLETIPTNLFKAYTHLLLIRDPAQIITSFVKGYPNPKMEDIGMAYQFALYAFFVKHGYPFVVLDSNEVLKSPQRVLSQLCERLGIPFDTAMLSWEPGARPEDGSWAKHWYHRVHKSSGFLASSSATPQLPDHCVPLYEEARPFYEALYLHALKA